jgi:hypothetical protein
MRSLKKLFGRVFADKGYVPQLLIKQICLIAVCKVDKPACTSLLR